MFRFLQFSAAQRNILWQLMRVWLIYLPWGWLLTVLSAPLWVIVVVIFMAWSSTAVKRENNEVLEAEVYGCSILLLAFILVFAVGGMLNFTFGLLNQEYHLSSGETVPGATLITFILVIIFPIYFGRRVPAEQFGLRAWYRTIQGWFYQIFWIVPLLLMYSWIFSIALLVHQLGAVRPILEKTSFDFSFVLAIFSAVFKFLKLVNLYDTALALALAWITSIAWVMPAARRNLLQVFVPFRFIPFGVATVLTLVAVGGLGSGCFLGKIIHL